MVVDEIEWLTDADVLSLLDELPHRPMLAGKDGLRLSLAGAQDKLPVVLSGDRIGLPRHGTPSSHILKPAIHTVRDSVINEGFCLALASAMKLNTARSGIKRIGERFFLLIERYDRVVDEHGYLQRLHQEDFCQASGVAPEFKYQNEGGPDFRSCFELVRLVTRPNAPQVLRLLDYVIFNALIGNHGAHAKNFSLLYRREGVVLAPFYDVLSTAVYPHLASSMAMKIGSKYRFEDVQARHWAQFADTAGLSVAQTRKRILELAGQLPVAARKLQSAPGSGFSGHQLIDAIIHLIEQRAQLTIHRLAAASYQ